MRVDELTGELPGVPKRRGRPATGSAMTDAERKRRSRSRRFAEGKGSLTVQVSVDVLEALRKHVQFKDEDQGQAVDRILRSYLLRKR